MAQSIYPLNIIKYWYTYDIDEICVLFDIHKQTVRAWLKNGLPSLDNIRPALIYGNDLKEFLGKQNKSNKCATEFHQMFCMKCKDARLPLQRKVKLTHKANFILAQAHCSTCKKVMGKSYSISAYSNLMQNFRAVELLELYDSKHSTVNTHLATSTKTQPNEPAQSELVFL